MIQDIRITTLVEDAASKAGLLAEHGLSFWIECAGKRILFDTGQSNAFVQNAKALNVDLADTDAIVISHGHYDHTGGLKAVLDIAVKAKVYLHPAAVEPKFNQKVSEAKSIGMSDSSKQAIQGRHLIWTAMPVQLFPGISVTGQVPRLNDYEDVGGAFFVDENCEKPDKLLDDQTLFIESTKGLVVVFGCAHSGVVNTLNYISKLTGQTKIYAVIGGMHLLNANRVRIANTIKALKQYEVQKIGPVHCTGDKAIREFEIAFSEQYFMCSVGTKLEL